MFVGETLPKMTPDYTLLAALMFLSRIILRRLSVLELDKFRKVERAIKTVIKIKADIIFLEFIVFIMF